MAVIILFAAIVTLPLAMGIIVLIVSKSHATKNKVRGLLFHSITPRQYTHFSHFSPDKFSKCIEALVRQNAITGTLKEAAHDETTRTFVLTFDDGFQNFFTLAFPILEAHSIKVTLFPIAGFIGRSSEWDVLPRQEHLSRSQIREIADHGHEIGSHTMTHADLTMLKKADIERELRDSKQILEDITGKPVTSLSFPFGSWNRRVWEMAQQFGYTQATICRSHGRSIKGLIPVRGVYSYDIVRDVLDKMYSPAFPLNSITRCRIMSHFAKGTPLWKFRKGYVLIE